MKQSFKIIYISGYGRSGSTIMDILLSQQAGVVGVGELNNLFTSGWSNNEYCACGDRVLDCSFWSEVRRQWEEESELSFSEYLHFQKQFISFKAILKIYLYRYFPSSEFKKFKNSTVKLYQVISEVSGCSIIVDSSKLPTRLLALKAMGIHLNILHLVRDGREIMKSLKRPLKRDLEGGVQNDIKAKTTFHTASRWSIFNFLVEVFKGRSLYTLVKYEDLTNENSLRKISADLNIDLQMVIDTVRTDKTLVKGHTVAGSRLRMKQNIKLQIERRGKEIHGRSKREDRFFNFLAFYFLKKYRYI